MNSLEMAKKIIKALEDKKGSDIKLLEVQDITVLADYFVIATGTSTTQVGALADEVDAQMAELGINASKIEGRQTKNWILLDYSNVIVHVFQPEAREFYSLERLWADAREMEAEAEAE